MDNLFIVASFGFIFMISHVALLMSHAVVLNTMYVCIIIIVIIIVIIIFKLIKCSNWVVQLDGTIN